MKLRRDAALSILLLTLAAGTAPAGEVNKDELKRARRLLVGPAEKLVREGANICLKQDNVPAMEVLLDVFNRPQPHYRDMVWDAIVRFKDPYARARVAKELRTNKKNPRVRQWCAQALGVYGDADHVGSLVKVLPARESYVRAAAVEALGHLKAASVWAKVERLTRDKSGEVRAAAAVALARIDREKGRGALWGVMDDDLARVRCATLGALPALYPDLAEETAVAALSDADWRPRIQAVQNLRAIETKTAVDALVRATADVRPVVANEAMGRLRELSGKKFTLPEQWKLWWAEAREAFEFPEGDEQKPVERESKTKASFGGLPVDSDHVAFVIDKSRTMNDTTSQGRKKDDLAREELEQTLRSVSGDFVFNVFTYGGELRGMSKEPVRLDEKTRDEALSFVDGIEPKGTKAIWEILEMVVSDPRIDTVYLLSSGEPEVGLYVHWNRVTDHLSRLNRFQKVTVHTVVWSERKWYRDQLQKIAECTGGRFIAGE